MNRSATSKESLIRFQTNGADDWMIGCDNVPGGNVSDFSIKTTQNSSPQFVIDTSGNVGIGITSPSAKLDVNGASFLRGTVNTGGGYDPTRYGSVQCVDTAGQSLIGYVRAGHHAVVSGFIAGTNDFTIAGWYIGGAGVKLVSGATAWTATSDERTKDIKSELTDVLAKLSGIRCVRYRYKTDCRKDKYGKCQYERERIGFIAQDVQKVFPEAVHDSGGELGLTYQDMIVVNTSAIKELCEENETLKTRLDSLEQRLLRIENPPWFRGTKRERFNSESS